MGRKDEVLTSLKQYLDWIDSLFLLSAEETKTPYEKGKWSPNEIVMHLAEWDDLR